MRFFFDNNLGKQLSDGMKMFGEDTMHLKEEFDEGADDEDWIPVIGDRGDILVTRDDHIRRNPRQRQLLVQHKVGAFFLGGKKLNRCDLIRQIVRNWPRMKELADTTAKPFTFRVPRGGKKIKRLQLK